MRRHAFDFPKAGVARPITLSDTQIRALLAGRLTELWIPMMPQPVSFDTAYIDRYDHDYDLFCGWTHENFLNLGEVGETPYSHSWKSPVGGLLTVLNVQEPFYADRRSSKDEINPAIIYSATPEWACKLLGGTFHCTAATGEHVTRLESRINLENHRFQELMPAEEMPHWATRFRLVVTGVEVRQLKTVADRSALASGVARISETGHYCFGDPADPIDADLNGRLPWVVFRHWFSTQYAHEIRKIHENPDHDHLPTSDIWAWRIGVAPVNNWRGMRDSRGVPSEEGI